MRRVHQGRGTVFARNSERRLLADTVEKLPSGTAVIYQLYVSVDEGAASCIMMASKTTSREFFNAIGQEPSFRQNLRPGICAYQEFHV
jgi:hypothetical protein